MNNSILLSSNDPRLISRTKSLSTRIKLPLFVVDNINEIDIEDSVNYSCVLIDCRGIALNEIAGSAQIVSQLFPDAKTSIIVSNKLKPEDIRFIYVSGANLILTETDFFNYNKIDFYLNYVLKNEWIPIKAWDFVANTEPDFGIYHYIPYQKKFLPIIYGVISEQKLDKMKSIGEIYIKREDIEKYSKFLAENKSPDENNLLSICRAAYMSFYDNYVELIYKLSDDSKYFTFEEGKKILDHSLKISQHFLDSLKLVEDPWLIVNNLNFEIDSSLARVPAIASYVGITAFALGIPNPEQVMLSCLVGDLGLFRISPDGILKDRRLLSEDDAVVYENHPKLSINMILERKVPINEKIKNIIMYSHGVELKTSDSNKLYKDKVPVESEIILLCELLDRELLRSIKESKRIPIEVIKENLISSMIQHQRIKLTTLFTIKDIWFKKEKIA